jgi:hypothetical protein
VPGQTQRLFYGGTTSEEINDRKNDRIGLQHWAKEGIAGTAEPNEFFNLLNLISPPRSWDPR